MLTPKIIPRLDRGSDVLTVSQGWSNRQEDGLTVGLGTETDRNCIESIWTLTP